MPIRPPALDDRSYDDLVAEMLRRIPAHTPEWTNPQPGDPGRTILDLTAWLADTILYRANLIPERQRLAFLKLLGTGMRPARPARGLVTFSLGDQAIPDRAPTAPRHAAIAGPVPFETQQETTVLPVSGLCCIKRRPDEAEARQFARLEEDLRAIYGASGPVSPYVATVLFASGFEPLGRDVVASSVDGALWIALLDPSKDTTPESRKAVVAALGGEGEGRRQAISIGVQPAEPGPASLDEPLTLRALPFRLSLSAPDAEGEPAFTRLTILSDTSAGLTRAGVIRAALPAAAQIGAPANSVAADVRAGSGVRPPRIDDPALSPRIVAWLRLDFEPQARVTRLALSWAGVNAADVEQRRSFGRRGLGVGDGGSDQSFALGAESVEAESLVIEVESPEIGFERWRQVADVATAGRDQPVYSLDAEAGVIRTGDGVRGRAVAPGMRVQAARMRAGGGAAGNLPAGTLKEAPPIEAGVPLKLAQPVPTAGGVDAESLADAERRIPRLIRTQNRAVTEDDVREIALRTPGVDLGRVEVLPRFKPQQRRENMPGVVSVVALPRASGFDAPWPRPDRPRLAAVHDWLDERRPLGVELYVIGCEYVPIALSIGVELADPDDSAAAFRRIEAAVRGWLFPLAPGGPKGEGWPLGRTVVNREIEVAVARVPGVSGVDDVRLFERPSRVWQEIKPVDGRAALPLLSWQLPELLVASIRVGEAAETPGFEPGFGASGAGVAIPIVPEVC